MKQRLPAHSVLAGREGRLLALGLVFLAFWSILSVSIALREPSLGWRFAPDPQGQGVLAYDPRKAVKVTERAQAGLRLLALRPAETDAGGAGRGDVIALESLIAVEAPSMLSRQEDLERFFDLQARVWALLDGAQARGQPVEVQLADGQWVTREVHPRQWSELGWLYGVPLLCGMVPFVVGMGVCAWRWQSVGARFLGLASVMALLALAEVAVVTGRLWLLPPWFAETGQIFVRCTSLVAVWAFVMMMLHYPTPLRQARAWTRGSAVLLGVLLVLNVLQWPDSQTLRYKLWLVVASASFIGLAVWQSLAHRADPVHRAAGRWLAASALVAFSVVIYAFVVSLVYDVQVVSNSYRWVSVPLLYIGLMVSVGRANLFELERWWVPLCLWYLGGTLVVLTDLALVALLRVDAGAAITLSLLVIGWLYFPARQWLLGRLQHSSRPRVMTYLPDLMGAVNAGLAGEQAAREAWRQLLERVFEPLAMERQPLVAPAAGEAPVRIDDLGRQLQVPDVGGEGVWQLTLARRGRQLFTDDHAQVAGQLWQLLDLGLSQQRQTQAAVDRERLRIASDLHDDLGAKLLSIVQAGQADGTAGLARQALDDMRQSVRGMTGKPLAAAEVLADWRAEMVGRLDAAGFSVQWDAQEPAPGLILSPRVHLQLTRVLREAVSNVIRHSGGRHCRVGLAFAGGELLLDVEDDGRGLPQAPSGAPPGLGWPNIERRARMLGGQHRFEASCLGGVRVHVAVPLAGGAVAGEADAP
jgi:signal transduction histidine kinase